MSVSAPPQKIEVELVSYLRLLVKANRFDPADWPAGYERGAELLREIRQIEQECVKAHGRWHPDLLSKLEWEQHHCLVAELEHVAEPDKKAPHRHVYDALWGELVPYTHGKVRKYDPEEAIEPPSYRRGWNAAIKAALSVVKGVVKRSRTGKVKKRVSAPKYVQKTIRGMKWG
jgi:hypothetical protein